MYCIQDLYDAKLEKKYFNAKYFAKKFFTPFQ